jgi:hypothetical protein
MRPAWVLSGDWLRTGTPADPSNSHRFVLIGYLEGRGEKRLEHKPEYSVTDKHKYIKTIKQIDRYRHNSLSTSVSFTMCME